MNRYHRPGALRKRHRTNRDKTTVIEVMKEALEGKKTYIGIAIAALGFVSQIFGEKIPTDEITNLLTWVQAHWSLLAEGVGLIIATYGRWAAKPGK